MMTKQQKVTAELLRKENGTEIRNDVSIQQAIVVCPAAPFLPRTSVHPGRTEFEEWLKSTDCPAGTIKTYADAVERIGRFLLDNGLEDRKIYSIRGVSRLERICSALLQSEDFSRSCASGSAQLDLHTLKSISVS